LQVHGPIRKFRPGSIFGGWIDLVPARSVPMSWSLEFDEPIPLASGKLLRTLRDAGEYVTALPQREADLSHWQVAASCLLQAVEKGGGLVVMARVAMVRALKAQGRRPKRTLRRKVTKRYRVVS
jgi:hypothetical protein